MRLFFLLTILYAFRIYISKDQKRHIIEVSSQKKRIEDIFPELHQSVSHFFSIKLATEELRMEVEIIFAIAGI